MAASIQNPTYTSINYNEVYKQTYAHKFGIH